MLFDSGLAVAAAIDAAAAGNALAYAGVIQKRAVVVLLLIANLCLFLLSQLLQLI